MRFYSTNRRSPETDFPTALFTGQAPDLGLFMPASIPNVSGKEWEKRLSQPYPELAAWMLSEWMGPCMPEGELLAICRDAYDFEIPVEPAAGGRRHVLRLDRGPTASFKDFAARAMARIMAALRRGSDRRLVVLTATSGDTGSAVAHAFHGVPGIDVVVLFPPAEVSDRQRRQMTTLEGNVLAVAVDGKFDHCQAMVKRAFADPSLRLPGLTSANSINIGRLLPQSVYHAYAYGRVAVYPEPVIVSVPSGNFGNAMGALLAKRMGLPLSRIVVATNANDEVPAYLRTGSYSPIDPSRVCISNAMNVGHPSNLARVVDLYGGWMDHAGRVNREPDMKRLRQDIFAVSVSDDETRDTLRRVWEDHRVLLEPHGAVGWTGLDRYIEASGDLFPCISVETAHPAKFPEDIEDLLGFSPTPPPALEGLEGKPEASTALPAEYGALAELLRARFGA